MKLNFLIIILYQLYSVDAFLKGQALLTHYYSYPSCCEESHIFDRNSEADECFKWIPCGKVEISDFAYRKPIEWFKSYDTVAFYAKGFDWEEWVRNFAGKVLRLTRNNITIEAVIANSCQDYKLNKNQCYTSKCQNCEIFNSTLNYPKYLIDMEYFTAIRHFDDLSEVNGAIDFEIVKPKFKYIGGGCLTDIDCNVFTDLACKNERCIIKNT